MKHPALIRKLAGYRYDELYTRYTWRATGVAALVAINLLLLVYCAFGDQIPAAVMGVLACLGIVLSVTIGHHFGSRSAKHKQHEEEKGEENATTKDHVS